MTVKLIVAFIISFLVATAAGSFLVPYLRKIKAGQSIREDGPTWHSPKAGTPTMGGIMFILSSAVVCVTVGFSDMVNGEYGHIFVLAFAMIFGAIGFLDDFEKLRKKQNLGLTARKKMLLQLVVAIAFIYLLRRFGYLSPNLYIPFINKVIPINEVVYFVLAAFIIVGAVNAVNITDGIDGLAAGTSIPVFLCYACVTFAWGTVFTPLGIFASGLAGGLLGFLVFNYNPAKIFMGDTGSLFLGGAVCAVAFAMDMPLILLPLGIIYVVETLSDLIQIFYFKATHGKRFFKMAPLHHHLEMGGWSGKKWSEKKLFGVFTLISALFAVISFLAVMGRYNI
jgi:phospho-N-acetylmuramoyl-pentapeptide-transferase